MTMTEILGAEIFRSGVWNDATYTDRDLDEMVAASREIGFVPPIVLGHHADEETPAVGRITNLKRIGSALYADLVSLPQAIYDLIRTRGYDFVSCEIIWNLQRNGRTFPRVLSALALLGRSLPAVDLAPLSTFLAISLPVSLAHCYAVELQLPPLSLSDFRRSYAQVHARSAAIAAAQTPADLVDAIVQARRYTRAQDSYGAVLRELLAEDRDLASLYLNIRKEG
jgi:hypothetical protein